MYKLLGLLALLLLGAGAWFVGNALSSDAIGLAMGVIFGTMASLPGAVLVLVAARREQSRRDPYYPPPRYSPPPQPPAALLPPPTVIIVQLPDGTRTRATVVQGQARIERRADD